MLMTINVERVQEHLRQIGREYLAATQPPQRRRDEIAQVALKKLLTASSVDQAIDDLEMDCEMARVLSTNPNAGAIQSDAAAWLKRRPGIYED